jgi:hypothetical protein
MTELTLAHDRTRLASPARPKLPGSLSEPWPLSCNEDLVPPPLESLATTPRHVAASIKGRAPSALFPFPGPCTRPPSRPLHLAQHAIAHAQGCSVAAGPSARVPARFLGSAKIESRPRVPAAVPPTAVHASAQLGLERQLPLHCASDPTASPLPSATTLDCSPVPSSAPPPPSPANSNGHGASSTWVSGKTDSPHHPLSFPLLPTLSRTLNRRNFGRQQGSVRQPWRCPICRLAPDESCNFLSFSYILQNLQKTSS